MTQHKDVPQESSYKAIKHKIDSFSGTFLITDPDSKILYSNNAVSKKTGFDIAEIIGKKPGQLWGGKMDSNFYKYLWKKISTDRMPCVVDVKNLRKDKKFFVEKMHITPILDTTGEIKFFIELQPAYHELEDPSFRKNFTTQFRSQGGCSWELIEFVFSILSLNQKDWKSISCENEMVDSRTQLISFLESILIRPTEKLYHERMVDRELLQAAKQDSKVFEILYTKYYQKILTYFLMHTGYIRELSEEFSQETFLQAFKSLKRFTSSNASYLTYLMRIAHNILVNYYRSHKILSMEDGVISETYAAPQIDYGAMFDLEQVWRAVRHLSPIEQRILYMKYERDMSVRDIAQVVKKTENAVKLCLSRGREKIKVLLNV